MNTSTHQPTLLHPGWSDLRTESCACWCHLPVRVFLKASSHLPFKCGGFGHSFHVEVAQASGLTAEAKTYIFFIRLLENHPVLRTHRSCDFSGVLMRRQTLPALVFRRWIGWLASRLDVRQASFPAIELGLDSMGDLPALAFLQVWTLACGGGRGRHRGKPFSFWCLIRRGKRETELEKGRRVN
jgi:hypothetical protein